MSMTQHIFALLWFCLMRGTKPWHRLSLIPSFLQLHLVISHSSWANARDRWALLPQFPLSNANGKHHCGCSNKTPQKHLLVFRPKYAIYHSCNKSDVTLRSSAPSLGFVRGHKSIVQLLLTINCALKFYSLFMMCNVTLFMWTQWVTGSNCGCFLRTVPSRRPPKNSSCQSTFSGPIPLRSKHFTAGHHGPEGKMRPSPCPSGPMRGNPNRVFWHMGETVFS